MRVGMGDLQPWLAVGGPLRLSCGRLPLTQSGGKLPPGLGGKLSLTPSPVGSKNVLAVKVGAVRGDDIEAKNEPGIVMLNFAHVLHRVRPLASLGVGLTLVVAWGAIWYGLLTLLW
jgi:hypothetical protein